MVEKHFFDLEETQAFMWMKGWRCMHCGLAVDPLIEANRRSQEATIRMLLCEEPDMENESVSDQVFFGGVGRSSRRSRTWSRQ
jgi:predicted exporter